jgi:hypothetical protein
MARGRPSKPIHMVKGHRTKAEKSVREKNEKQLLTGITLKESDEVKHNLIAHKEFIRIKKLLEAIGKNDDLSGHIINQHCILVAECKQMEKVRDMFEQNLEEFEDNACNEDITFTDRMKIKMGMQKQILDCDKALMSKRKMLLDIGKENILTIASALRSVPKKPETEENVDPMARFISQRG